MKSVMNVILGISHAKMPASFGIKALKSPTDFLLLILVFAILIVFLAVFIFLIRLYQSKVLDKTDLNAPQGRIKLTPTRQFILAASSPTPANNYKCVIDIWGTHKLEAEVKRAIELFEWGWGDCTYENAKEMAYYCLESGHNIKYQEYCAAGTSSPEFAKEYSKLQMELFEEMKRRYPKQGMLAWDLVRTLSVVGGAYMGGAMEYEEAAQIALEACKRLQDNFSSWDDMVENYTLGYQFWRDKRMNDRLKYYKKLKKTWIYDIAWNTALREEEL